MFNESIVAGTIQNPPTTETVTIAAFDEVPIFYAYNYFRVISGAFARGDIEVRFSETGQPAKLITGQAVKLPVVVGRVSLRNTTDEAITVTVALGIGDIYDDTLSVSGELQVVNASGTELDVVDNANYGRLNNIFKTLIEDGLYGIAPKTTLEGATAFNVAGSTTTLVTGAANTDGIILRTAMAWQSSLGRAGYIKAGAGYLYRTGNMQHDAYNVAENIFIPSGDELVVYTSDANMTISGYYEAL